MSDNSTNFEEQLREQADATDLWKERYLAMLNQNTELEMRLRRVQRERNELQAKLDESQAAVVKNMMEGASNKKGAPIDKVN